MTLRLVARPNGLLIPVSDLNLKDLPARDLIVGDDIQLVLANLLGFDGNQPRLLKVDANGNLRVAQAVAALLSPVNLTQLASAAFNSGHAAFDGNVPAPTLPATVFPTLWNNASWDRARSASAAIQAAQSGLGVALASGPGEWAVNSAPAAGAAPSAVRAAGAAGVRHIGKSVSLVISSQAALAAVATVTLNIRDGAAGAGTILEQYNIDLPAAIVAPFALLLTGLNLVGTAATAMTAELAAAVAGLRAAISVRGYDAS